MNADQSAALLDWILRQPRGGKRLHAFFATLYYCALRSEEAVAMRVQDVTLPAAGAGDQWCELLIHTATPEVGKQWTDTGGIHEERDLKGRAEGETRTVPGHPALTRILRQHIKDEQIKPGDLLFQGETGGILAGLFIRRAWRGARKAVLPRTSSSRPRAGGCTTTGTRASRSGSTTGFHPPKWRTGPATASRCSWGPTRDASRVSFLT
ncbi:site-specific integrase [Streptomyces antibioticus]|uniref:hypothetical protein n=1 Tax=Streptomyces antibioticus TaxID=1890 RepID=UPI00224CB675|nr:hypothetical protein [Streptomyces antibioticus]MCX4739099.1 hypothetical protein [Streptomyces antibioticus]